MPHSESSFVPASITSKQAFWDHVLLQLTGLLLDGRQRNWVSSLANAASLIYHSLLAFPSHFGSADTKAVNWVGFYLDSHLFPTQQPPPRPPQPSDDGVRKLLLGPFCGRPACQFIDIFPNPRGVCADAFIQKQTVIVPDIELYPSHIACDGDTKSEIVVPLILHRGSHDQEDILLGVLDLDCLAVNGFDPDDKSGLEKIADFIVSACDW